MSDGIPVCEPITVVLALKELQHAKSRLAAEPAALGDRAALVAAMFADTVDAVRAAGAQTIVVVSPDPQVHRTARALGALALDEPAGASGLNAALRHGAAAATGGVVYLQADLPALRAETFGAALAAAAAYPAAFVADRHRTGTALLAVGAGIGVRPAFGPDSAAAHRAAGAVELDPQQRWWPDLRCDVDTPGDLRIASDLGVGPRTRAVLSVPACDAAHDRGR
ncbi:2-phospho-L-lactate guanylyltransferase [Gordonia caeni]